MNVLLKQLVGPSHGQEGVPNLWGSRLIRTISCPGRLGPCV